jgi:hypothetical protein
LWLDCPPFTLRTHTHMHTGSYRNKIVCSNQVPVAHAYNPTYLGG